MNLIFPLRAAGWDCLPGLSLSPWTVMLVRDGNPLALASVWCRARWRQGALQLGNEGQEEQLVMGVPQVILLMILGAGIGVGLIKHGEPRQGNHSFPVAVAAVVIECALLYWGGFFG